jgi:hypothetical protein
MDKTVAAWRTPLSELNGSVHFHTAKRAVRGARFMFFLLRLAFWLGLVLVLLPVGSGPQRPAGKTITASEAISAASATVGDLRDFCTRQPTACSVGSQVATTLRYRAQAGAKMLYQALSKALAPRQDSSLAAARGHDDSAKPALDRAAPDQSPQGTLTPADLAPAWRGPHLRDGRHSA